MQFTLTYRGPLPGQGSAVQKHQIRRALHPQIKELWTHLPLSGNRKWLGPTVSDDPDAGCAIRTTGTHSFAVLVTDRYHLVAELDVLMLRPERPGRILQRADIDNRLKTLFDALRFPDKEQEIPKDWTPSTEEDPLYCLLDDDRLVTRVNVDTDRLLDPGSGDEALVTVRVKLRAWSPTYGSVGLIG